MRNINKTILLFGSIFMGVFFMSIFMPGGKSEDGGMLIVQGMNQQNQSYPYPNQYPNEYQYQQNYENNYQQNQNLNPGQQMEQQLQQEQSQTYRSYQQDENLYYKEASPEANEAPDYYLQDHPLKEQPLQEDLVQ